MSFNKINVVILGAGQIGQAVNVLVQRLGFSVTLWDQVNAANVSIVMDFATVDLTELVDTLLGVGATHVINCLPFNLNEKVAKAAGGAGANYIDFTEDDMMADRVQAIYAIHPELTCAVKCGLAPGYINYVGRHLSEQVAKAESLMICVGALPRHVNGTSATQTYNLSWSVDGLVNEYIRPCRVRMNGKETQIPALTGLEQVLIDGVPYEAAFTSGGIGSLAKDLKHIPNVCYKTLRYPGHYVYVEEAVKRNHSDFDRIKAEFLKTFPLNTTGDVIVTYAECKGRDANGRYVRHVEATRFTGVDGLSAIQSTTAGGGVGILELMLMQPTKYRGIINHSDINIFDFMNTKTVKYAYKEV